MASTAMNTIGEMEGDGASFKLNGQSADDSDLIVALNELDHSDLAERRRMKRGSTRTLSRIAVIVTRNTGGIYENVNATVSPLPPRV